MKSDPDYIRLLKTIRHEEPDRVPLVELSISREVDKYIRKTNFRHWLSSVGKRKALLKVCKPNWSNYH